MHGLNPSIKPNKCSAAQREAHFTGVRFQRRGGRRSTSRNRVAEAPNAAHSACGGSAARTSDQVRPKGGRASNDSRQHRLPGALLGQRVRHYDRQRVEVATAALLRQRGLGPQRHARRHARAVVHVGTRISIWAENSHISLGSAFAHTHVHGRERYDASSAQIWFLLLV